MAKDLTADLKKEYEGTIVAIAAATSDGNVGLVRSLHKEAAETLTRIAQSHRAQGGAGLNKAAWVLEQLAAKHAQQA